MPALPPFTSPPDAPEPAVPPVPSVVPTVPPVVPAVLPDVGGSLFSAAGCRLLAQPIAARASAKLLVATRRDDGIAPILALPGSDGTRVADCRYEIRTARVFGTIYALCVKSLGQFCAVARTLDVLGERWSLLIVRELLCGSHRFGDIRRGIPRISRTMLSARLRELADVGVIERSTLGGATSYELTAAGKELEAVVSALGVWGQRWLPRTLPAEDLDAEALVWDVQRRVCREALPKTPIVVRIEFADVHGRAGVRFLLLRQNEVSLCGENPGFPDVLRIRGSLRTLTAWWRGDCSLAEARSLGMKVEGRREWVRAFPSWFLRYAFADVPSVRSAV
jgi:DNA-binding HxlR family transcriptional regulator